MFVLKNKGTLPCDFCGKWQLLITVEKKYLLCDYCAKHYDILKPEKHERLTLELWPVNNQ